MGYFKRNGNFHNVEVQDSLGGKNSKQKKMSKKKFIYKMKVAFNDLSGQIVFHYINERKFILEL